MEKTILTPKDITGIQLPCKLTMKQESFCLAYLETGNASEAYRRSYNAVNMKEATVWRKAHDLVRNGNVAARVEELRQQLAERAQVTLEKHLDDLKSLRNKAETAEKFGPAIQAEIARGKAAGLYSDGKNNGVEDNLAEAFKAIAKLLPV
jgi:phage terminase small subunit